MEGRGFSGLYKNSSEELFLKTVMESPIGMPVPTMEMLGFKTVSQSFRADSEELFKRWLTNEEVGFYMIYDQRILFNISDYNLCIFVCEIRDTIQRAWDLTVDYRRGEYMLMKYELFLTEFFFSNLLKYYIF